MKFPGDSQRFFRGLPDGTGRRDGRIRRNDESALFLYTGLAGKRANCGLIHGNSFPPRAWLKDYSRKKDKKRAPAHKGNKNGAKTRELNKNPPKGRTEREEGGGWRKQKAPWM